MDDRTTRGDLAAEFERYAGWAADVTPLYGTLAAAAAEDERLLGIAADARPGQPAPQLLLAAVHSLLLDGVDHPLADYYPSCGGETTDRRTGANEGDDGGVVARFREFCLANEERLRDLLATRRVQTNDVGRTAVLLPAFERVARTAETRTLAQIEIGTSAGLNLNWDRYRYRYRSGETDDAGPSDRLDRTDSAVRTAGDPDSPVEVGAAVRGDRRPPIPRRFPRVVHRTGVDLNPLDPTDPADARWLRALVHPDQPDRRERLDAAIDAARTARPDLVEGDAVETLPRLLAEAPDDAALVVFSTHVLYQLDDETVADLRATLREHGFERPVHWLSIDPDEDLGKPVYRHVRFVDGAAEESHLARFESYGEWLRWIGR
ncbi:DUF2332 domain-containing protein [Salinilacihabitans rarus]|uniref:DUF2332 domain-containing protein n=1 Tax=Salinilacihabitans rarus TaxID=2961596 RepID=UPI0020C886AE|nr:DUF2332 domain-containing protein [Salinilacihabitans rarus]